MFWRLPWHPRLCLPWIMCCRWIFHVTLLGFLWCASRSAATDAKLGLSVGEGGTLLLNGRPFRGIGVNYYDLFARTLQDPPNTNGDAGLMVLSKAAIPFARFSAGGYWPSDWSLYQTNRAEYFSRFDRVVKAAERLGVGLIPSLFWFSSTVPDLVKEPASAWGQTNSRTHAFMREYTREVVARYRGSRAIWAWEFGNEYNLPADLPNAAEHRPPIVPSMGTPSTRSKNDDLTHGAIRIAFRVFGEEVRRLDRTRVIVSGNAFPRVSAWHQAAERSWVRDTPEQFAEVLAADNPSPMNVLSVRGYDSASDFGRLAQAMEVARSLKKPLFVGEFGVPGESTAQAKETFTTMLHSMETLQVPLAALWVFDFDSQAKDWNVTPTNGRGWQLREIQQANERWLKSLRRLKGGVSELQP